MWINVATPPFTSIEQMEARYVGTADDGTLRVISL